MKKKSVAGLFTIAALLPTVAGAMGPQIALGQSQFAIGISGFVPVICRAHVGVDSAPVSSGTVSLGSLQEFCNSANGYKVVASYSPSLAGARLLVDGTPVTLSETGSSVVSQSDTAAAATHQLVIELPEGVSAGALSFRIDPL